MFKLLAILAFFQSGDTLDLRNCNDGYGPLVRKEIVQAEISKSKHILLGCNNLTSLQNLNLSHVEYLKIGANPLSQLDPRQPLLNIIHLDISGTGIYSLPKTLMSSPKLRRLDAIGNPFSVNGIDTLSFPSLEILNVDYISVKEPVVFDMPRLYNIGISFGEDDDLNKRLLDQVGRLPALKRLSVYHDNFDLEDLAKLPNKNQIEVFYIMLNDDDTFCNLTKELSGWSGLKVLGVTINGKSVPDCISTLQNVETLVLKTKKGNGKVDMPASLDDLTNLKSIYQFKNFSEFNLDQSKIAFLQSSMPPTVYDRKGFKTIQYRNPLFIR